MMNRRSVVKMFLSVITAPAQLIDFLIGRCHVNPPLFKYSSCKFDPPRYSRYKHVRPNTIGVVNVHSLGNCMVSSHWPKFAALRLFVETMPIYKAVATGNRKNKLYRETARSNCPHPDPPHFSLLSTCKVIQKIREDMFFVCK
jgi:hypothetical protein